MMGHIKTAASLAKTGKEFMGNVNELHAGAKNLGGADKSELAGNAANKAFSHGAGVGKAMGKDAFVAVEVYPRFGARVLQFLFALVAVGFYGNRVDADRKSGNGFAPEWLFAVTLCGCSAISALIFAGIIAPAFFPGGSKLVVLKTQRLWPLDAVLCVGWLTLFGMMAGIFLKRKPDDPYKGSKTGVMKVAVWIDLVNMVLWMISAIYGCLKERLSKKFDEFAGTLGTRIFSRKKKGKKGQEMNNMESV